MFCKADPVILHELLQLQKLSFGELNTINCSYMFKPKPWLQSSTNRLASVVISEASIMIKKASSSRSHAACELTLKMQRSA